MKYIEYWISILKEQFKNATVEEKRDIRTNIFKNIHLTESQKEQVWEQIISIKKN